MFIDVVEVCFGIRNVFVQWPVATLCPLNGRIFCNGRRLTSPRLLLIAKLSVELLFMRHKSPIMAGPKAHFYFKIRWHIRSNKMLYAF